MSNSLLLSRTAYFCSTAILLISISLPSSAIYLSSKTIAQRNTPIKRDRVQTYIPPKNSRTSREDVHAHGTVGSRACGSELVALAPHKKSNPIGQTASTRPTFVWYELNNSAGVLEFFLYRYTSKGEREKMEDYTRRIRKRKDGFNAYSIPADKLPLKTGETYFWGLIFYCDKSMKNIGGLVSANIDIVKIPNGLNSRLPNDPIEKARMYARSGLWYDAISIVFQGNTFKEKDFRKNLLLDLTVLEKGSGFASQLKEILELI